MLKLYQTYSRNDVQKIFDPNYQFEPSRGTWGLHGVIKLPNKQNDWVFFVTYGHKVSGYQFDEGITPDGVLTWQSQPSQGFDNERINQWINQDQTVDNIHLFVRQNKKTEYRYLGLINYIEHDGERQKPVWFQFQIQDFNPPKSVYEEIKGNSFQESLLEPIYQNFEPTRYDPPTKRTKSIPTRAFNTIKMPDLSNQEKKNKVLGLAGELFVLGLETKRLIEAGRSDLADRIEHTSQVQGDGAGYDIRSFSVTGEELFVEVKTTQGGKNSSFYITPNELHFGKLNSTNYCLMRVFNFKLDIGKGDYFKLVGDPINHLNLVATNYRASF